MKSIKDETINEIIINRSRFIAVISNVFSKADADEKLKEIKKKYKDATHYCYAYITKESERCSDDKEPTGTAGMPILNMLKKADVTNVLCVVIRYFGGIKLGSNGLIRAYLSSTKEVLDKCTFINLEEGYKITIKFKYENLKNVDYILKDYKCEKIFENDIYYTFCIPHSDLEKINLERYAQIIKKEKTMTFKD